MYLIISSSFIPSVLDSDELNDFLELSTGSNDLKEIDFSENSILKEVACSFCSSELD